MEQTENFDCPIDPPTRYTLLHIDQALEELNTLRALLVRYGLNHYRVIMGALLNKPPRD